MACAVAEVSLFRAGGLGRLVDARAGGFEGDEARVGGGRPGTEEAVRVTHDHVERVGRRDPLAVADTEARHDRVGVLAALFPG